MIPVLAKPVKAPKQSNETLYEKIILDDKNVYPWCESLSSSVCCATYSLDFVQCCYSLIKKYRRLKSQQI
jgi:hypothetical protein